LPTPDLDSSDMKLSRDHARLVATGAMGFACAYLSVAHYFGRLNYTVPTTEPLLGAIVLSTIWPTAFLGVGTFVGVAMLARRWHRQAMQTVFAVMAPWGLFNLAWGLTSERPVSLAGPGLAIVVAIVAQALALTWVTESLDPTTEGR